MISQLTTLLSLASAKEGPYFRIFLCPLFLCVYFKTMPRIGRRRRASTTFTSSSPPPPPTNPGIFCMQMVVENSLHYLYLSH